MVDTTSRFVVLNPGCTLESPGELLKTPMLRRHPKPIKLDTQGVKPRLWCLLKAPLMILMLIQA